MKARDVIREVIEAKGGYEKGALDENLKLQQDLCIDSLDIINFVVKIEEQFDVELFDALDEKIYDMTVKQFCDFVETIIRKREKGFDIISRSQ